MAAGVVLFSFSHVLLLFFTLFVPLVAFKIDRNQQEQNNFNTMDVECGKDVKTADCGGKLLQKVEGIIEFHISDAI
jgi:hypothetical protein